MKLSSKLAFSYQKKPIYIFPEVATYKSEEQTLQVKNSQYRLIFEGNVKFTPKEEEEIAKLENFIQESGQVLDPQM